MYISQGSVVTQIRWGYSLYSE